jgi:hypothetical protein
MKPGLFILLDPKVDNWHAQPVGEPMGVDGAIKLIDDMEEGKRLRFTAEGLVEHLVLERTKSGVRYVGYDRMRSADGKTKGTQKPRLWSFFSGLRGVDLSLDKARELLWKIRDTKFVIPSSNLLFYEVDGYRSQWPRSEFRHNYDIRGVSNIPLTTDDIRGLLAKLEDKRYFAISPKSAKFHFLFSGRPNGHAHFHGYNWNRKYNKNLGVWRTVDRNINTDLKLYHKFNNAAPKAVMPVETIVRLLGELGVSI